MFIKTGYSAETISRYSSYISAEVLINTTLPKIRSNLQNIIEEETQREKRERGVSLQSTATVLSAGSVTVQYGARYRTHILTEIAVRQRKCDKGEMVRIVCAVWRSWKLCVLAFMSQPF